jgi:hypothetical protein
MERRRKGLGSAGGSYLAAKNLAIVYRICRRTAFNGDGEAWMVYVGGLWVTGIPSYVSGISINQH